MKPLLKPDYNWARSPARPPSAIPRIQSRMELCVCDFSGEIPVILERIWSGDDTSLLNIIIITLYEK